MSMVQFNSRGGRMGLRLGYCIHRLTLSFGSTALRLLLRLVPGALGGGGCGGAGLSRWLPSEDHNGAADGGVG